MTKSLEYDGPYGGRFTCKDCVHCPIGSGYAPCEKQGVDILRSNNVCRAFEARIKNPSSPEFNFIDYLEYLGSDFYRPYGITDEIIGYIDRPSFYIHDKRHKIPMYKTVDKPWCHVHMPRAHVEHNGHKFEIDYVRYSEMRTVEDGAIRFDLHLWKDTPRQRKYKKETYGRYEMEVD